MVFSSSHVQKWELDHKKGWAPKDWCFQTVVLEKTLESSLDSKEIKPVNPKGNQHWIFTGRSDAEAEVPILWLPDAKSWLIGKDSCWERLRAGGEEGNRGWDGWQASLTQWSISKPGSWWLTEKPGVLQSMGSQNWTGLSDWTELNWVPTSLGSVCLWSVCSHHLPPGFSWWVQLVS